MHVPAENCGRNPNLALRADRARRAMASRSPRLGVVLLLLGGLRAASAHGHPGDCEALPLPFVQISFDNAVLKWSNLGYQGGQNTPAGNSTPPTIMYGNVAQLDDGTPVDIEISNTSFYMGWGPQGNGIRGAFSTINLAAPRNEYTWGFQYLSYVELRFAFKHGVTGASLQLPRTKIS